MSLVLESIQWSSLPDINEVEAIGETDREVLEEIREVLARHDRMDRFGVCLLHKHFDLTESEIAVEYTDIEKRTSTITVEPRDASAGTFIQTNWRFRKEGAQNVTVCEVKCHYDNGHNQVHVKVGK